MSKVRVMLIVVCCMFVACTAAWASAPVNVNGDFESGVLAPWISSYDPSVTYSVIVDPNNPSNHIVQGVPGPDHDTLPPNYWLCNLSQTFAISPNTKYLARIDIKTVGDWEWATKDYGSIDLYEENAMGIVWANHNISTESIAHDWERRSVIFTSNSHGVIGFMFYNGQLISGNQAVYLDNFQLFPVDSTEKPFNGNFELGGVDGWSVSGAAAKFGVSTVNPHSGSYCCEITGRVPVGNSNMSQYIDVQPDTDYLASVYYRNEGADWLGVWDPAHNLVDNTILEYNASGTNIGRQRLGAITQLASNWTRLVTGFHTSPSTVQLYWYNGQIIQDGQKFFLDDFKVTKVEYLPYDNIGKLKADGEYTYATFDGIVTRGDVLNVFVESADRSAGILVETGDFPLGADPLPGDVLHLKGHVAKSTTPGFVGMLVFAADEQPTAGTPVTPLGALGTNLRAVASTVGGAPLECLFVKIWGTVANADAGLGTFTIDDGSGPIGVSFCYDYPFPNNGDYVAVTGNVVTNSGTRALYIQPYGQVEIIKPAGS